MASLTGPGSTVQKHRFDMAEPLSKTGLCNNCKVNRTFILHLYLFANGSENFMWVCASCNRRNPSGGDLFIAKDLVEQYMTPEQIKDLPVIANAPTSRCARCGSRNCELHHWAPKGIFGKDEAEQWPQDFLCKSCHDLWHMAVTPQLVK